METIIVIVIITIVVLWSARYFYRSFQGKEHCCSCGQKENSCAKNNNCRDNLNNQNND